MYRMDETGNVDLATVEPVLHDVASTSDDSLVEAARSGDVSAFEEIFERHRRRVSRLVGRFFNRPERVEEIIQDVFTKVYFGLGAYSPDRGASFAAWLSRVSINVCYDELRRARRRPESTLDDITPEELDWLSQQRIEQQAVAANAESRVVSQDLANKLLARLVPDDRIVLTLLDAEGQSVAEIASVMGWKISKVKVRAHRARLALRKILEEFV